MIESIELTFLGESSTRYLESMSGKLLNGYSPDIESILKIMRREELGFLVDHKSLMVMGAPETRSMCKSANIEG